MKDPAFRLPHAHSCPFAIVGAVALFFPLLRVAAQPVTFPDPALEDAVRYSLGIPAPTAITQTDMRSLTNLYADWRGIHDTTGLQYATNLAACYANGNSITNFIGLSPLWSLRQLHLYSNGIKDPAPLAGLTNLQQLSLDWNGVTNASALAPLTALTNLWLSGNAVSNLSFLSGMKRLQLVALYYNQIRDLSPLAGLTNLVEVDIGWNGAIGHLGIVTNWPWLERFWAGNDSITNATPLGSRWRLTNLGLEGNPLTSLSPVAGLTNLTFLDINGSSGITNVPVLAGLTNLTELHMSGVPGGNFAYLATLTKLEGLNLETTGLPDLSPVLGRTTLRRLWIGNNPSLTDVSGLATLPDLTELGVWNLGIQDVSFLSSLTNLQGLNLNNNRVGDLTPMGQMPDLHWLYLYDNWVADPAALLPLPYLWYVELGYNFLDLSSGSAASNTVATLRAQGTDVRTDPPREEMVPITLQPTDQCAPTGGSATFFAQAASLYWGTLTYQWQFKGVDLPGQTNAVLVLTGVSSNQAGPYRAIVRQDWHMGATLDAELVVDGPGCNNDLVIQTQPQSWCAAPGEDVSFTVTATTVNTDLFYQWQFNGTNIVDATDAELFLVAVSPAEAGFYQVVVTDDMGNTRTSIAAELKVVTEVTFPDPALDLAIHEALGLGPGPVPLFDLDSLSWLNLSGRGITNLAGLECARGLESLRLDGNPIANPELLGWLHNLDYLYVNNCQLASIAFLASLVELREFQFSDNHVLDFSPLGGCLLLYSLEANRNNAQGCPVNQAVLANLTQMGWLSLESCCLTDIGFLTNMPSLGFFNAGRNFITNAAPVASCTGLWYINLSENQVFDVTVLNGLNNLNQIYLGSNPLADSAWLGSKTALWALGIENTGITDLSGLAGKTNVHWLNLANLTAAPAQFSVLAGLTNLDSLYAGGNNLPDVAFLANLKQLHWLGLERNRITNAAPLANLREITWVNLEQNLISSAAPLAAPRTNLQWLYLSDNHVTDLSPLAGLTNLSALSFRGNGATSVAPLSGLFRLDWLSMASNAVTSLSPLAGLTNLRTLDFVANQVADLSPVAAMPRLEWFGPAFNSLTSLPSLAGLTNVTWLDFQGNRLTNITGLSGMPLLDWVRFADNRLTDLPALSNLPRLSTFDAPSNTLASVAGLAGVPSLHWIYLYENNLESLQPLTNFPAIYWLDVRWNLLNTNAGSAAMQEIAAIQSHGAGVNYVPQKTPGSNIQLLAPERLGSGAFRFTIQSPAGITFEIRRGGDAGNAAAWPVIGYATNVVGTVQFTDPAPGFGPRFYRARQL